MYTGDKCPTEKCRESAKLKTGAELIAEERQRQIRKEGFDEDHDDSHDAGQLALAAACYACNAATWAQRGKALKGNYAKYSEPGFRWPWRLKWWKPKSQIQDLVRAGALIAAEIDRLQREN